MINWTASYPKSGNTWVRLFLNAYFRGDEFNIRERPANFIHDIDRKFYAKLAPIDPAKLTDGECALMRATAMLRISRVFKVVECKTHVANRMIDWVPLIPPAVTRAAVYIIRDPRDVAVSAADHYGKDVDEVICDMEDERFQIYRPEHSFLKQFLGSWSDHVKSWTQEKSFPVCVVKYEDLKATPLKQFRHILKTLGYEQDKDEILKAIERTQFERLQKDEAEHGFEGKSPHQERFFRKGKTGGWKDILTADQAKAIEADHETVMREFGYI